MQPRRDTDRQAAAGAGFGTPAEDDFESVKPVGYEARLAFERERTAEAESSVSFLWFQVWEAISLPWAMARLMVSP